MELNQTYSHAHYPGEYSFVPTEYTGKGCRGLLTTSYPHRPRKKPKTTTAFYTEADFKADGIWVRNHKS